jgi:hypothetical protein
MSAKKTKLFTMKVTDAEKSQWQTLAKSHRVSLSELVRQNLNQTKPKKIHRPKTVDPELLRAINAIGNNLNQISRRLNEGQKFDAVIELSAIEEKLERVLHAHQIH